MISFNLEQLKLSRYFLHPDLEFGWNSTETELNYCE